MHRFSHVAYFQFLFTYVAPKPGNVVKKREDRPKNAYLVGKSLLIIRDP